MWMDPKERPLQGGSWLRRKAQTEGAYPRPQRGGNQITSSVTACGRATFP